MRFYDMLTRQALSAVLGIPEQRFALDNEPNSPDYQLPSAQKTSGDSQKLSVGGDAADPRSRRPLRLQEPWAGYMRVYRRPVGLADLRPCDYRPWFKVEPVIERLVARKIDESAAEEGTAAAPSLFAIGTTGDRVWSFLVEPQRYWDRWTYLTAIDPLYTSESRFLDILPICAGAGAKPQQGDDEAAARQRSCDGPLLAGDVSLTDPALPAGFFNFVESMAELDAYAYAVFPKNDVLGVIRDLSFAAELPFGEGLGRYLQRITESVTEPMLVGFGDGVEAGKKGEVRFGWIVTAPGPLQTSLKTQLALVSVPAWTDKLRVQVTSGWLDAQSDLRDWQTKDHAEIKLPPDYAAFDTIFQHDASVQREPRIQDDAMDKEIYVVAGKPASILIPGSRLWRSATVTLGAQSASRIRVLPNMEGIIATFDEIDLPFAKYNPFPVPVPVPGEEKKQRPAECSLDELTPGSSVPARIEEFEGLRVRPVRLRVWTSEGVALAARKACVIYDPKTQVQPGPDATEPQQKPQEGVADKAAGTPHVSTEDGAAAAPAQEPSGAARDVGPATQRTVVPRSLPQVQGVPVGCG
jgi:hypothetical protein